MGVVGMENHKHLLMMLWENVVSDCVSFYVNLITYVLAYFYKEFYTVCMITVCILFYHQENQLKLKMAMRYGASELQIRLDQLTCLFGMIMASKCNLVI